MKGSAAEQFELLYRRIWGALNRPDDGDLSQHERQLLHHVPPDGSVSLSSLAEHLGLPKSTASVMVKSLGQRGFVERARDSADERRLAIVLTGEGRARVAADTVLDPRRLRSALAKLSPETRATLLEGMAQLADAADASKKQG